MCPSDFVSLGFSSPMSLLVPSLQFVRGKFLRICKNVSAFSLLFCDVNSYYPIFTVVSFDEYTFPRNTGIAVPPGSFSGFHDAFMSNVRFRHTVVYCFFCRKYTK